MDIIVLPTDREIIEFVASKGYRINNNNKNKIHIEVRVTEKSG
jgi:hypothetical protein